jgi:large repetitive protein
VALPQIVSKSSTSTALSSSNTDATFSNSVTFTATVTSQTAVPTSNVTFKDGTTSIGMVTVNGSGVATLTLTTLSVGPHSISAVYAGDGNNSTSTSSLVSQTIEQIATSTVLTSNTNPSPAGANVHLTATITAALSLSATPLTGSVLFTDGAATLGTSNVAGGLATLDVAALAIGQHTIVATYSGATDYAGSISPSLSQTVQLSPTVETLAAAPSPGIAGRTVALTATITSSGSIPTGGVTFKDGINNLGQGALNAEGIATFSTSTLTAGSHSITGVYAGDTNSQPATANLMLIVNQATTAVVLNSSGSPATVGLPLTLRATTTGNGATPSGSVTFFEGTTSLGSAQMDGSGLASLVLSSLTVGTHSITAVYSGDANDATNASAIFNQVIQKTTTSTTLTSTSVTVSQGTSVQFAAQVSSNAGIPGGAVQFFDGTTLIGTGTVNAAGVAVLNVSNLLVGQHNIIAVYSGDTNDGPSTSTSVTQIVQPITIVGLTSDHNPASIGAVLTFTAGVSGANTIPTGTITFKDGSSILGVSTINGAGVATMSTSALSAGSHLITAAYPGDGNNSASVSAVYNQVLQQATTQTVLSVGASTASYGSSVTISVAVTGSGGTPTGSVTVLDGATALGTANLTPAGTAIFASSSLSLGQHVLTATYGGDQNDATSTSAPVVLTIQKQTVSLSIASNSNPSLGGLAVSFTAALQASSGVPTGSITWSDGAAILATTPVSGNGASSYTTSSLTPGQHTITATYSGDSTNGIATSNPIVETIQQATSAVSLTSNKNPGLVGDVITYSIAVTGNGAQPGGTAILKDGNTAIGTVTLDANGLGALTTSSLTVGSHTLVVVYAGDAYHAGSQSGLLTEVVLQGTTTSLTSSSNPSLGGNPVIFTAAIIVAGNVPITGTVIFKDGAMVLGVSAISTAGVATYTANSLSPGQHSITASYSGDSLNQPSVTAALIQTVQTVSTTTTLSATPSPSVLGGTITLTAQINGTGNTPTGTVSFMDGSNLIGSGVIAAGGVATLTVSTLAPGQHILLAIYLGDPDHLTSTSNPLLQAVLQHTSTTLTSSLNPSLAANNVSFAVSVSNGVNTALPSGAVTLMDGSTVIGTATLSAAGTATFSTSALTVGQHTLSAVYAGDSQNFTSTSSTLAETVRLHGSTNILTASSTSVVQGQSLTLVATLSGDDTIPPGGAIVFTSGTTTLGTATLNASGIATLTISPTIGTYTILATYSGDSLYTGSTSSPMAITVADTTHFTITLNPATMSLQSKQHNTIQLTLTSIQGFTDILALGCVGLPNAATCTFSTDQPSLSANGTQTASLTIDTGSPLTAGGLASNRAELRTGITLCLLPGGFLFFFSIRRSRNAGRVFGSLMALLVFVMSMAVTGCGTLQVNGTPQGTYTFSVTAIGNKTGATQSAPIVLTVTQ